MLNQHTSESSLNWHGLTWIGGTFESDTGGTFHSDMPGTFQSAADGTFVSAIDGTFQSDMSGTFGPLLSLTGSATARTSRDSFPEPGQRKTKSLPSSTNQVRLEPTSYKLGLVGPNSNILCQINTVFTGCLP